MTDTRRALPSIGKLLESAEVQLLLADHPRAVVLNCLRGVIDDARRNNRDLSGTALQAELKARIELAVVPTLRRVINATGVVLHTNLGRAPLASAAIAAIEAIARGYSNLEYDLDKGARGSRYSHCVGLLQELTGAEDALVVNNCAAALVLSLATLSGGKDAIVSRGELVEIGGSFRIPEIMRASGARLVEVGTTNRTHIDDYIRASTPDTGAYVKVHRSNFSVSGFVAEVGIDRLAPVASERGIPVIHDLGSGLLISLESVGLSGEPTAADAIRAGATLVVMSGDKLLGGPQAGIIVGKAAAIGRLRTNPLVRALRVDKLTIAALSATLQLYREPAKAMAEIPVLAMLSQDVDSLDHRAHGIQSSLQLDGIPSTVVQTASTVGAGAFPAAELESRAVAIAGPAREIEQRLRAAPSPVIGRIQDDTFLLDVRTVLPAEDAALTSEIVRALQ